MLSLLAIIGIITKASVSSLESSYFSKYSGAPQGHHVIFPIIFPAKGPPPPAPSPIYIIYHCYISYIIYHCCILVGTNNAATRWWQSLRNSPLPFLLSPTPLAFVIHPRPQVSCVLPLHGESLFELRKSPVFRQNSRQIWDALFLPAGTLTYDLRQTCTCYIIFEKWQSIARN